MLIMYQKDYIYKLLRLFRLVFSHRIIVPQAVLIISAFWVFNSPFMCWYDFFAAFFKIGLIFLKELGLMLSANGYEED